MLNFQRGILLFVGMIIVILLVLCASAYAVQIADARVNTDYSLFAPLIARDVPLIGRDIVPCGNGDGSDKSGGTGDGICFNNGQPTPTPVDGIVLIEPPVYTYTPTPLPTQAPSPTQTQQAVSSYPQQVEKLIVVYRPYGVDAFSKYTTHSDSLVTQKVWRSPGPGTIKFDSSIFSERVVCGPSDQVVLCGEATRGVSSGVTVHGQAWSDDARTVDPVEVIVETYEDGHD